MAKDKKKKSLRPKAIPPKGFRECNVKSDY
jgi:hypothetical protein